MSAPSNALPAFRESASQLVRPDIEQAARLGYMDALTTPAFCVAYHTAEPRWQRNYETGRLWAVAFRALTGGAPDWPDGQPRPNGFADAIRQIGRLDGDVVPMNRHAPPDESLAFHVRLPGRRRR